MKIRGPFRIKFAQFGSVALAKLNFEFKLTRFRILSLRKVDLLAKLNFELYQRRLPQKSSTHHRERLGFGRDAHGNEYLKIDRVSEWVSECVSDKRRNKKWLI